VILASRDDFGPAKGLFDWEATVEKRSVRAVSVLVIAVVVFIVFGVGQRSSARRLAWRAASRAYYEAIGHCLAQGQEVHARVKLAWDMRTTLAQFEKHFGYVSLVGQQELPVADPDITHVYTHGPSRRVFYLRFEDNVLVHFVSPFGPDVFMADVPTVHERMAQIL